MGKREDLFAVAVTVVRTVNGDETAKNLGTFDTFEGGETESEDTKYNRGGLQGQESLGGRRSVGNVTVARLYDEFMQEVEPWLDAGVGSARVTVTKQPLDEEGNAWGRPRVYTGKLIGLTPPDHDSESSDASRIELVVGTHGNIG